MENSESDIKEITHQDRSKVTHSIEAVEGRADFFPRKIVDRLSLLAQTLFFDPHSTEIACAINNFAVFTSTSKSVLVQRFSPDEYNGVKYAALVHDIGKTGPAEVPFKTQKSVMSVFTMGHVTDKNASIELLLSQAYGQEKAHDILTELKVCGVSSQLSFGDFKDLHSIWTRDVLEKEWYGQSTHNSEEDKKNINTIIINASSHHIDQGANPYHISFENNKEFPSLTFLLVILDKTNALYGRASMSIPEALTKARMAIGRRFSYYKEDITEYLKQLNRMAQKGDFFKESFGA